MRARYSLDGAEGGRERQRTAETRGQPAKRGSDGPMRGREPMPPGTRTTPPGSESDAPLSAWCKARNLGALDLARLAGCSLRAAERWLAGRQTPGPAFRARLYQVTGLEVFASSAPRRSLPGAPPGSAAPPSGATPAGSATPSGHATPAGGATPAGHAIPAGPAAPGPAYARETQAFLAALDELEAALGPFARGPAAARDYLRRGVDPSRVARVTNLAQLLFNENDFSDWLLLDTALGGESRCRAGDGGGRCRGEARPRSAESRPGSGRRAESRAGRGAETRSGKDRRDD